MKKIVSILTAMLASVAVVLGGGLPAQAGPLETFTVTNVVTGQPLTTLAATVGTAVNEEYLIELSGSWDFSGGWGYGGVSVNQSNGLTRTVTKDDTGATTVFHVVFGGTPTTSDYRKQSIQIMDSASNSFDYAFNLAVSNTEGPTLLGYTPSSYAFGNPALPSGKNSLFTGGAFPKVFVVNPNNGDLVEAAYPTNPYSISSRTVGGMFEVSYTTDTLYVDPTFGDIVASVTLNFTDNGQFTATVNPWSYSWEGEPMSLQAVLRADLASGASTEWSLSSANRGYALSNSSNSPFVRFASENNDGVLTQVDGVVTITALARSSNSFSINMYDYTGCPTLAEMVAAEEGGGLNVTGYAGDACAPLSSDINGNWYAIDWTTFPALYSVNKTTGQITMIGSRSTVATDGIAGFDINATTKKGYFLNYSSSTTKLFEVDVTTGVFTEIAVVADVQSVTAFDIRPNGDAWFAADYNNITGHENVYGKIDLTTGAVTEVGYGMRFSSFATAPDGKFYGTEYGGKLYVFDGANWNLVVQLPVDPMAADFDLDGKLTLQDWSGKVVKVDVNTLEVITLWNEYTTDGTTPSGMNGEAFTVAADVTAGVDDFGGLTPSTPPVATTLAADKEAISEGESVSFTTNAAGNTAAALFVDGVFVASGTIGTAGSLNWSDFGVCTARVVTLRVYDAVFTDQTFAWTDAYAATVNVTFNAGTTGACAPPVVTPPVVEPPVVTPPVVQPPVVTPPVVVPPTVINPPSATIPPAGVKSGETVNATGSNLQGVTKVTVGGVEVVFTNNTAGGFSYVMPKLKAGIYTMVVVGSFGTITLVDEIKVAATLDTKTKSFAGFAHDSSKLNAKMVKDIKAWVVAHPKGANYDITGYTMGPFVRKSDAKLALARATAVRKLIKSLDASATFTTSKKTEKRTGDKVRRATVTVTFDAHA